ncbi:MAG: pyridoxamine 5'-phosphate oxidase family protein [Candidatus Omnitrophota bacterium]|nr:MAG: pyridoxamine 5'-phosphate oxidase family protein [Candidatus Omnitrophota bacterium]
MAKITDSIKNFFENQNFVIISTIDKNGTLHNSCKGIIEIREHSKVYLLDLYKARTMVNLKNNPNIAITAVDEHKFKGYSIKGQARIINMQDCQPHVVKAWEAKLASRISQRVIKNMLSKKEHPLHPEALLPKPEYVIEVVIHDVIDLTPHNLK